MRWLTFVALSALTACSYPNATDEAFFEQQHAAAWSDALFASVDEHAGCAGFHRANAELASGTKSRTTFYVTAAQNAEITATEIAASELPEDLAVDMVNQLTEIYAAEWIYAIESQTRPGIVLSQAERCQTLAQGQGNVVRELVKAKYGFKLQ